ncbi:hypothetical protein ABZ318_31090 [Streptomyces sp. NPDC006197]|uniref:hypothetical protein n=1 Tax=Streptomyces sp. NPDC006197 TaxID=3156685 RepID=UPI0033AC723B
MGRQVMALGQQVNAARDFVADLTAATEEEFLTHPDADIITGFPGLSAVSGA